MAKATVKAKSAPEPVYDVAISFLVADEKIASAIKTRLAGLNVRAYQIGIYTLSGATAGLAGMLLAARTGSGQPISGSEGLELEAITAAVLGGCALTGGKGTIIGGLLGVLIIGVLDNGLILTSVPTFFQMVAKGVLLIVAVIIAELQARRYG